MFMSKASLWGLGIGLSLSIIGPSSSIAASVTYHFAGYINYVNGGLSCEQVTCDPSLIGSGPSAIGTGFTGEYTFDDAWSPFSSSANEARYSSPANSPVYTARIGLAGVSLTFDGLLLEVSQTIGGNGFPTAHYQASAQGTGSTSAYAGGQLLPYGTWAMILYSSDVWGDGSTNIPTSIPLLSEFDGERFFGLQANQQSDIYWQYRGYINYLDASPCGDQCPGPTMPSAVPIPAALPLLATALGALGFIGWRRKHRAKAAA